MTLEEEIEKLSILIEHTNSKSKKRNLIISLNNLIELYSKINDIEYNFNYINDQDLNFLLKKYVNMDIEYYKIISNDDYINNIKILCNNSLDKLENYDYSLHINPTFTLNDSKEIIIDFFNSFDKSLEKYIIDLINKNTFTIINKEKNSTGYTFQNTNSLKNYILLYVSDNKRFSTENLSCLVHELGHAIHFKTIKNRTNLYSKVIANNFREFPSCLFELFFLKYLQKNKISIMNTEKAIHNNLNFIKVYIKCLNFSNSVIKYIFPLHEYNVEEIKELFINNNLELTLDDDDIKNAIGDLKENYFYSINGLLSYYFYEKYALDKEKTKSNIYNIIRCIGVEPDSYMFNDLSINLDEFLKCEYLNDTIKNNQRILKK